MYKLSLDYTKDAVSKINNKQQDGVTHTLIPTKAGRSMICEASLIYSFRPIKVTRRTPVSKSKHINE